MAGILDTIRDKIKGKTDEALSDVQPFKALQKSVGAIQKGGDILSGKLDPKKEAEKQEKWQQKNDPYQRIDETIKKVQ